MKFSTAQVWALLWFGLSLWGFMGLALADKTLASVVNLIYISQILSLLALLAAFGIFKIGTALRFPFSWGILGVLSLLWLWGMWAAPQRDLPALWSYIPFSLFWFWSACGFMLTMGDQHKLGGVVGFGARIFSMGIITLILLEILLRVFQNQLPPELTERAAYLSPASTRSSEVAMPPQIPIRNYNWAGQQSTYTFYNTDGDLYRLTCLEKPRETQALYEVDISYSPEGFRQTTSEQADFVVIGDSFTFAAYNPEPFWWGLYPEVVSMGAPGSGALEQSYMLEAFAPQRQPKVIVMAFFAGNDLQDSWRFKIAAEAYQNKSSTDAIDPRAAFRPLRLLSTYATVLWVIDEVKPLERLAEGECPYPVTDAYGNELAFFEDYISMGTVATDQLRESDIFQITADSIRSAKATADSIGAAFVLMYIPDKFQAHWPGILEADLLPDFAERIHPFQMTESGFIPANGFSEEEIADMLRDNIDNQRTLLAELSAEEDILWLDLTPQLQAAAAEGQPAYFFADTHFSNEGHAMVREILREFLMDHGLLE